MPDLLTEAVPALEWLGLYPYLRAGTCVLWLDNHRFIDPTRHDLFNAQARDLILDALEAKGYVWTFDNLGFDNADEGKYRVRIGVGPPDAVWEPTKHGDGTTLTEAVLKAAIAAHKAVKEMEGRS